MFERWGLKAGLDGFGVCLLRAVAAALLAACGSTNSSSGLAPTGPDAGAGCDSAIHDHCTYAGGEVAPDLGPSCIEYSGASRDHASCPAEVSLAPAGEYAAGPCPRNEYDRSCVLIDTPAADAGECLAFETIWARSSDWPDAGLIGYRPCVNQ